MNEHNHCPDNKAVRRGVFLKKIRQKVSSNPTIPVQQVFDQVVDEEICSDRMNSKTWRVCVYGQNTWEQNSCHHCQPLLVIAAALRIYFLSVLFTVHLKMLQWELLSVVSLKPSSITSHMFRYFLTMFHCHRIWLKSAYWVRTVSVDSMITIVIRTKPVSYTHLTLPTKRIV